MKSIGIIANPASGKDIRRLIASGMTITNQEKQNSLMRMLLAMDALGVEAVEIMPDTTGLARRVVDQVQAELKHTRINLLEMPYILGTANDSLRAAQQMAERDFACVLVLGGDGTSRIVAKGCGDLPLIPVSTGTNNVFPQMVEGTLVGMAAAALAHEVVSVDESCDRAPRLELWCVDELVDIALVDLVIVDACDIAARAVWEPDSIREVYLTQAGPASIGLSAIGAQLHSLVAFHQSDYRPVAMKVVLGKEGQELVAPIAPGLLAPVSIRHHQLFGEGDWQSIDCQSGVVALDGERELVLSREARYRVKFNPIGPRVVNVERTLNAAIREQFLISNKIKVGC